MAIGDLYDDPVEAAKKRMMQQRTNQSYFPAAILSQFAANSPTSGSIFKPGFDLDNPLGTPTPAPTPKPSPTPPVTTNFQLPSGFGAGFQFAQSASPLSGGARSPGVGAYGSNQVTDQANLNVASAMSRPTFTLGFQPAMLNQIPGINQPYQPPQQLGVIGNPTQYAKNDMLYGENRQKYGWNG